MRVLWGRLSAKASDVRAALSLIESLSRDAESVMRTIIAGHPDYPKYGTVMADRTTLSVKLRRALGRLHDYADVERALALYGPTLRFADPNFGIAASEADIAAMRAAEARLHQSVMSKVDRQFFWNLFGHERSK